MNAIGKTWHFSAELIVSGEINYLDESQFFPGKLVGEAKKVGIVHVKDILTIGFLYNVPNIKII